MSAQRKVHGSEQAKIDRRIATKKWQKNHRRIYLENNCHLVIGFIHPVIQQQKIDQSESFLSPPTPPPRQEKLASLDFCFQHLGIVGGAQYFGVLK